MSTSVYRIRLSLVLLLTASCTAPALAEGSRVQDRGTQLVELVQRPERFRQQRLELRAGTYVFRVHNQGVDHPVDFRLFRIRDDGGVGDAVSTAALGRTVNDGETASSGVVTLRPGKYTYRSWLNPTPHYFIYVE